MAEISNRAARAASDSSPVTAQSSSLTMNLAPLPCLHATSPCSTVPNVPARIRSSSTRLKTADCHASVQISWIGRGTARTAVRASVPRMSARVAVRSASRPRGHSPAASANRPASTASRAARSDSGNGLPVVEMSSPNTSACRELSSNAPRM